MGCRQSWQFSVFVIVCALLVDAQWVPAEEFCKTPDNEAGDCVVVNECKPMMDVLDAVSQPIPKKVINLLKAYQCGFSGRNPKVCCPSKPIFVEGITTTRGPAPPPPDVSRHRNIGLVPKNCGDFDTGDKILYGNKTGLFEFPWMALLSYRTNRGPDFRCGATIINEKYILTAAHCITNLKNPLLGVRVGEHNIQTSIDCEVSREGDRTCAPPHQDLAIEEIIPHPDYNTKLFTNDIGLLRVTPMDLTRDNTKPVCLPLEGARNYNFTNRNCLVTGWGVTELFRSSPELLKAQIPTIQNAECSSIYKNVTTITHRQLCAGGKTKSDSCSGDSGGPLQAPSYIFGNTRLVQQGIVSFGPKRCGQQGLPGVYTRVAYYMDWILDNLKP